MLRKPLILGWVLLAGGAGCRRGSPEAESMSAPAPPPAAEIAPVQESMPPEDKLWRLEHEGRELD
ncbi:MAG: hypothetical protein HY703_13770 [Gemmatimonadetes bacterium]|nr:hypothetical protein [Gemmatimonadota bacterium]